MLQNIADFADFFSGQPIERNADYGFHQLTEIALKALSPGINDPATAVLSLHALGAVLKFKLTHLLPYLVYDHKKPPGSTDQVQLFLRISKSALSRSGIMAKKTSIFKINYLK